MASARTKIAIGGFTLGGIILFVLALIYLSSESFFQKKSEYVLYFEGSVSGLHVGAPVVFRGVPLGSVTRISLVFDRRSSAITIPVYIQLNESSIVRMTGQKLSGSVQERIIKHMVKNGLCARLQMQSLVTGQYRIELDYHTNAKQTFKMESAQNEIPTVPSPIDTLQKSLAEVPIQQMAHSVTNILTSLANALGDGNELKEGIASLRQAFDSMRTTFNHIDANLNSPMRASLAATLKNTNTLTDTLVANVPRLLTSLEQTLENLSRTTERMKRISATTEQMFAPGSPAMQDLRRLFKESAEAARSLHNLAEMLNRNPEALLKGKQGRR
ncbi:MAG: MCE family protein [Desulfovibrionaceae bacterium]|nr:MCE family protein [Desulfovibrionaceae bacterium]